MKPAAAGPDADVDVVNSNAHNNVCSDNNNNSNNKLKLEIWGIAQHEAVRLLTSDLKYILGVVRCVKI